MALSTQFTALRMHTDASQWRVVKVDAPGPYVDIARGPDGAMWLTSAGLDGFIRVGSNGATKVFHTPGFRPSYITSVGDGRLWSVDSSRPRAVGALTTTGQLTIYIQPSKIERLPVTKIVGNVYETVSYASVGQLVRMGGQSGFTDPGAFAYPSGLTHNDDIAMIALPGDDIWFTECCLPSGQGIAGNLPGFIGQLDEYPLPYAQCGHPAGIAADAAGSLYVACTGGAEPLLVALDPATGKTSRTAFPVDYRTVVNTELGAGDNVYFTPGTSASLWAFEPARHKFVAYPTPDGSMPTSIADAGDGAHLWVLAGSQRQVDVFAY